MSNAKCSECHGTTLFKNIAHKWDKNSNAWVPMYTPVVPPTAFCYDCGIKVTVTYQEKTNVQKDK